MHVTDEMSLASEDWEDGIGEECLDWPLEALACVESRRGAEVEPRSRNMQGTGHDSARLSEEESRMAVLRGTEGLKPDFRVP